MVNDQAGNTCGYREVQETVSRSVELEAQEEPLHALAHEIQTLAEQKQALQRVLDALAHPLLVINAEDYSLVLANRLASRAMAAGTSTCYAASHRRSTPCSAEAGFTCPMEIIRKTKAPAVVEHVHHTPDGGVHLVEVHAFPVFDDHGRLMQMVEFSIDVTHRRRAEERLRRQLKASEAVKSTTRRLAGCRDQAALVRVTLEAAHRFLEAEVCTLALRDGDDLDITTTVSDQGRVEPASPLFNHDLGSAALAKGELFLTGEADPPPEPFAGQQGVQCVVSAPLGSLGCFQAGCRAPTLAIDDIRMLQSILDDAADALERLRHQAELERQARLDPLTGAFNRRYLEHVLERESARAERLGSAVGLLMIDINDFKEINDRFGHLTGDFILRRVAELLATAVRTSDTVIRYGGDEFLVVLPDPQEHTDAVVRRIFASVATENTKGGFGTDGARINLSAGLATWEPGASKTIDDALVEADFFMYEDKRRRKETSSGMHIPDSGDASDGVHSLPLRARDSMDS